MKKTPFFIIIIAFCLILSGCVKIKSKEEAQSLGGIFKTENQAKNWLPAMTIASTPDKPLNISGFNVSEISVDPSDSNAIYIGTETNGIFVSYDNAQKWIQFPSLSQGYISSIKIDPKNKCLIFVGTGNRILRSDDCARNWKQIYFDTRQNASITDMAIDSYNTSLIYAGNSFGDVLQSKDGGGSWSTIYRAENQIISLELGADTRNIYAATKDRGVHRSTDAGANWVDLSDKIRPAGYFSNLTNLALDRKNNVMIISTGHGLLRSRDGGDSWENIPLITAPGSAVIYSLAVNENNANEIYYGTATTFYQTVDGGANWVSAQLPVPSIASKLLVNPASSQVIYLGFKKIEK